MDGAALAEGTLVDLITGGGRVLDDEEKRVLGAILARRPNARDSAAAADRSASRWARLADRVAAVGGSWAFILGFFAVLATWVVVNTQFGTLAAFDPYPFIFLNLLLSMLAAIQAPIILMSQNRASERDRIAAAHDYEVNLRAELEILSLHSKLDALRAENEARLARQQAELSMLLRAELAVHRGTLGGGG